MISHKHKFIFVHIPKTGGQSLYKNLGGWRKCKPQGFDHRLKKYRQHFTMLDYLEEWGSPERLAPYFKFGFVRNPWDRIMSEYMWASRTYSKFGTGHLRDFITKYWINSRRHLTIKQHMTSQYDFLFDGDGNQLVDFIGRFENLQEDFNVVCDKLGLPKQELPHKNKSKHKHYTEYYDDETREIVAEKYAKDIEHFGYEFGE